MANSKSSTLTSILKYVLPIATILVTITVWAMTQHTDIMDRAQNMDDQVEQRVKDDTKDKYVRKHEFYPVLEKLQHIKESLDRIEDKLNQQQ